tara:strand:- start:226 stop:1104 length:879 start_codon:yes stop_codon:yes gene_type:complete
MKNLLFILAIIISFNSYGQYSGYYDVNVNSNVNVNANIKKDINISGNVTKTVTTIDYGALAIANASKERNRIESLKIANERDRQAMIAIAEDPSKAYDYGKDNVWTATRKQAGNFGFKKFTWIHKVPHTSLFNEVSGRGYVYQNISDNFITTEIELNGFWRVSGIKDKNMKEAFKNNFNGIFSSVEEFVKYPDYIPGEYSEKIKAFIHKKEINKTKVYGVDGFKGTFIYENDYEIVIKDNYIAQVNGIILQAGVRYKADKDEATFEDLEGRRYYFRRLADKIISTSIIKDTK